MELRQGTAGAAMELRRRAGRCCDGASPMPSGAALELRRRAADAAIEVCQGCPVLHWSFVGGPPVLQWRSAEAVWCCIGASSEGRRCCNGGPPRPSGAALELRRRAAGAAMEVRRGHHRVLHWSFVGGPPMLRWRSGEAVWCCIGASLGLLKLRRVPSVLCGAP
ncbi:hypothetical protein VPH35_063522 [Triticum aestivum]